MRSHLRHRIERLEAVIAPKGKIFSCFYSGDDPGGPSEEWIAAERVSRGVGPHDMLIVVRFAWDERETA
jgi:hypothetical protein